MTTLKSMPRTSTGHRARCIAFMLFIGSSIPLAAQAAQEPQGVLTLYQTVDNNTELSCSFDVPATGSDTIVRFYPGIRMVNAKAMKPTRRISCSSPIQSAFVMRRLQPALFSPTNKPPNSIAAKTATGSNWKRPAPSRRWKKWGWIISLTIPVMSQTSVATRRHAALGSNGSIPKASFLKANSTA